MPTPKPDTPPYRDFHTCKANFVYEKPSPLRIVKYDTNAGNNIHDATSHIRTNNARVGQVSPKADESLIAPKRRRLDQDGGAAGKENLRTPQGSGSAGFEDREALQGTKARQHDGSPPCRLGVTPPPQLTVRKTRQPYTHARAQTSPCEASSLSCTFPASHGLRRSVKCRPPLSNICDEAVVLAESPPSTPYAPGRVEASLPSSRRISAATSPVPLLLQSRVTYMLVPHVVITPEVTALEAGRHRVWVAIEVSSRLWPVPGIETKPGSRWKLPGQFMDSGGLSEHDQREDPYDFVGFSDLDVQVKSTAKSFIGRVLQDESFPLSTLHPGSSILLLAEAQIDVKPDIGKEKPGHYRQKSDDLMEDLEVELGDSRVEYIEVHLSYCHSALPISKDVEIADNSMLSMQSKVKTVATAYIKLHNTMSPWAPPPPSPNPLFPLIERH
ncbi:hypothetical protein FALBO_362 [Fusarium albosuccineum]|uniref:Uncharacterized protein n=1 Tax=Fusarium albosuccineum TaxID=1237068 RepID=A0A8H4PH68_9HYPO|nr:hypothetical protein FALBO_362 [Fusarium albosuccineum]